MTCLREHLQKRLVGIILSNIVVFTINKEEDGYQLRYWQESLVFGQREPYGCEKSKFSIYKLLARLAAGKRPVLKKPCVVLFSNFFD